jgi:lysozyme
MLTKLRQKLKQRIRSRNRQVGKWEQTKAPGYAKAARGHVRAIRKLRRIIRRKTDASNATLSDKGAAFISSFEGFFSKPYNDPVGYATVGYGHLLGYRPVNDADRQGVWIKGQDKPGQLTEREARQLLRQKVAADYAPAVKALFDKGGPLEGQFTQEFFDGLVSFAFNLGPGAVTPGTPGFETVGKAINSGNRRAIASALLLYDKAGGSALPGLTRRRRAENRLIRTGNYSTEFP